MKLAILGSEGFIGKNLFNYYSLNGYETFGIDIIPKVANNYYCFNTEEQDYISIFGKEKFDICINASGAANVSLSLQDPEWDYNLNVKNVFNILEAIRQTNRRCKFIQFSSAAVYGNPLSLPASEDESIKPLSPYGFHKWQSELLCKEFFEIFNIPTCVLRIFSAYGVGLKKQLFWDIYQKSQSEKKIILFGTGNESRDFIFIDDLIHAIDCTIRNGKFQAEIYNVANGEEINIKGAVMYLLKTLKWNGAIDFSGETRIGDPLNWKADISKLKTLGYKQKIDFEQGIELYSKWLKESE